ncbi:hypothetical protein, partial [Streptomyces sp. NPDC005046]
GHQTPNASLTPSETMPDQQESSDQVRLRYGFSDANSRCQKGLDASPFEEEELVSRSAEVRPAAEGGILHVHPSPSTQPGIHL